MNRIQPRGTRALALILLALPCALSARPAPRAVVPVPRSAVAADSLAMRLVSSPERLVAFTTWARGASLDDLVFVLRRPVSELGELEWPAIEAALARTPAGRTELRDRLAARLARSAPTRRRKPVVVPSAPPAPWASASTFRVALVLPSAGEHAGEAPQIESGFRAGLESRAVRGRPPIELVIAHTGRDLPAEAAAAFDSVAPLAALMCGGFTQGSTQTLAAGSRWSGLSLLLPLVDDVASTQLTARAWAIGPTSEERGRTLAAATQAGFGDRIAMITSSNSDSSFGSGFTTACRARGATLVSQSEYAAGNLSFSAEVRSLVNQRVNVLFWDGDASEIVALLRQLTRDRVSLRICGGEGLDPARHHRETRVLLEGVLFVPADWALSDSSRSALDRALSERGAPPARALEVRGWLAGRIAGAALATGALTPGELATAIAHANPETGASLRVMAVRGEGAELPVYSVSGGRAVRVPE